MKVGDRVRLIGIPPDIDLDAKSTVQKCLAQEFTVSAVNEVGYAELEIDFITGTSDDKILVAPRFLEIISK
jgi:hypothetical protein